MIVALRVASSVIVDHPGAAHEKILLQDEVNRTQNHRSILSTFPTLCSSSQKRSPRFRVSPKLGP